MERPKPSEIREMILEQHRVLKMRLSALEEAARELQAKKILPADLKRFASELYAMLISHVQDEERLLVPELRDADGFGPARVNAFLEEHEQQRRILGEILKSIKETSNHEELIQRIYGLVERIRNDIEEEESTHLSPNLLKDDIVSSEFIG